MSSPESPDGSNDDVALAYNTTDNPQSEELLRQHYATLIFLSYRYSQGGIGTQNRMLQFIEENFYPGMMNMEDSRVSDLVEKLVGRYFLDPQLHPAAAVPWSEQFDPETIPIKTEALVHNELGDLFARFKDRSLLADFGSDPLGIAGSVITMDYDYLQRPGGRSGNSEELKIVVAPYPRDPFDSLFVKHGVLLQGTKTVEYDTIFGLVGSEEIIRQLDIFSLHQLQRIIQVYIDHHPDSATDPRIVYTADLCRELTYGK